MTQPTIRLYDYWRSSAAYRVRIALNIKGLAYTSVPVNLLASEQSAEPYRATNPQGLVPTIEIDGRRIVQSLAIIDYLDRRFPAPPLLPADPFARADAMALALIVACDIHPPLNLRMGRRLKQDLSVDDDGRARWTEHWMGEGLAAMEAMAPDTPYLAGEAPGLPDLCLVPQLYNARRNAVALDSYPKLVAIDARCTALASFAAAHPDRVGAP
ncbi:maleylacetoacetate isomerase [uncultured Sphingomonas sp.]|uniref:maleylacetoacetate isomerase n=1 Tax=uncultured Sphingomonas sp. TaxID=158754 RepID=UPI00260C621B|nr:maleylacetoacetate isomerase [uncultured Sphingomonas sp.]